MILDVIHAARRRARDIQESLYDSICNISIFKNCEDEDGTTQRDEIYIENQPCKLSKKSLPTSNQTDAENIITSVPQLFLSPDIEVLPGSRIIVMQVRGERTITSHYEQSGIPAIYDTHQELTMKLADRRA